MQRRTLLAGLAAGALARPSLAFAQAWAPSRPVTLILGFPPGGSSDAAVRIIQPYLQAALGQSVVEDNRAGAGGNLGAQAVARAVAELVAAAKARPEAITYGTGGVGSPGHLCGILFDHLAGTKTVAVPYRGGGPQILAAVAGEHDFGFSPLGTVLGHIQAGTLRALGVATATRAAELPDIPTMAQAGLATFEVLNWDGIVVPRDTPAPIVARIGEVVRATLADPEVVTAFKRRGLEAWPTTSQAMAAQLAADAAKWQPLIRAAGIEPS